LNSKLNAAILEVMRYTMLQQCKVVS